MTDEDADLTSETSMWAVAEVFKAVAHPVRAHILDLLRRGESTIPDLCEGTGVKATHLSRHLAQMRSQRLIECRRTGGRLVYQLAHPKVAQLIEAAETILQPQAAATPAALAARSSNYAGPTLPAVSAPIPRPGSLNGKTFSEEQFAALEATLASRSIIADACRSIAARSSCSLDEAAEHLIRMARDGDITLREAAAREFRHP